MPPPTTNPPEGNTERPLDKVEGVLERVTFHNEENGYTVAKLMPEGGRDLVTVLGSFTNLVVGESLVCYGVWTRHPQWGPQMQMHHYETLRPATAAAIEKYLGSGMVRGVGPVMAKRIVKKFGADTLEIIEKKPRKLLLVEGIGEKKLGQIKEAWAAQNEIRNIMIFLQGHGVSPTYAVKIYKTYQGRSIDIVERNPYQLAADIWGIGFKTADQIAQNIGFALDDPRRIEAGVEFALNEAVETGGNAYLTREELVQTAGELLGDGDIESAIDALVSANRLVEEEAEMLGVKEAAIYVPSLYAVEKGIATRLQRLVAYRSLFPDTPKADAWLDKVLEKNGVPLSEEQREAVKLALSSRAMVLTGGPGTGKTTTTKAIVAAFHALNKSVYLASPTGRAAKRLTEVTGYAAKTIHRLLAYDPSARAFKHNADEQLSCDVLLVDEASMLDMVLANAVLRAVPPEAQLILVGDVDQLPSVGPGNVLRDLIESGAVPVARLTQVFRQAAMSTIITNAHRINKGEFPSLPKPSETDKDFVFVSAEEAEEVAAKAVAVVAKSLPKRGYRAADIQVLTPMQRGSAGAAYLNSRLQEVLNPPRPERLEVARGQRIFRVADRVIQMRNNYEKGVFNGDIGTVAHIDHEQELVFVGFPDGEISYEFSELDELSLAYALSVHKSQGSEFPVAVIALHTQHYALLQRNLLYTAITRAKKFAVLVGNKRAVAIAVKNDKQAARHTRLKERLQGLL
jgi:exodeoxyribonuclease V alpha subunit